MVRLISFETRILGEQTVLGKNVLWRSIMPSVLDLSPDSLRLRTERAATDDLDVCY